MSKWGRAQDLAADTGSEELLAYWLLEEWAKNAELNRRITELEQARRPPMGALMEADPDLIERLRADHRAELPLTGNPTIFSAAADRIERLEQAIRTHRAAFDDVPEHADLDLWAALGDEEWSRRNL